MGSQAVTEFFLAGIQSLFFLNEISGKGAGLTKMDGDGCKLTVFRLGSAISLGWSVQRHISVQLKSSSSN
jgi:hypothetical protein